MDAQIEALLCAKCRGIVAAALKLERAQAAAKAARDELRAFAGESMQAKPKTTEPEPSRAEAMRAAKAKMRGAEPDVVRPTTRHGHIVVAHAQIMRTMRGEIRVPDLAAELGVSTATIRRHVEELIGPAGGQNAERWRKDVGFFRNGRPAIEQLDEHGKLKRAAAKRIGGPRVEGPNDDDLKRLVNKTVSAADIAAQYGVSEQTVYRRLAEFRERFGADVVAEVADEAPAALDVPPVDMIVEAAATEPAEEAPPGAVVPDSDCFRIHKKKRTIQQIAKKHGIRVMDVQARMKQWQAARRTSAGTITPNGTEIVERVLSN